jgi:hypothetical protein
MISAPHHRTLTTALYIAGDKYLDSDAVFGSRESLVAGYRSSDEKGSPMDALEFNFILDPEPS